jgi:hypothetical protein
LAVFPFEWPHLHQTRVRNTPALLDCTFGKAGDISGAMLENPPFQVVGNADIKDTIICIRHYVDVVVFQELIPLSTPTGSFAALRMTGMVLEHE